MQKSKVMTTIGNDLWPLPIILYECPLAFYIWLHIFNMADGWWAKYLWNDLISQNTTNNNKNIWLQRFKIYFLGKKKNII